MKRFLMLFLTGAVGLGALVDSQAHQQPSPSSIAQPETLPRLTLQLGHAGAVTSVAISPDGKVALTGGNDETAKLWDVETGFLIRTLRGHGGNVASVAFSPSGRQIATGGADGTATLWNAESGEEIRTLKGHSNVVMSIAFSPDGKELLTGSEDFTAKLWGLETGEELRSIQESSLVSSVAFSPNGRTILTGSFDNTAKLWDVQTGQLIRTFKGHANFVKCVAFSPDGREVLTGSTDNTAKLWDLETGQEIRTLRGHSYWVTSIAFSRDGGRILTGSEDHTAKLWDAKTGNEIRTFKGHSSNVLGVAFAPDGNEVLTGSDDMTARLWNTDTGALLHTLSGPSDPLRSAEFFPDEQRVLTWSGDYAARLWDASTGGVTSVFSRQRWIVDNVVFSPDRRRLLTGNLDGTADLWDAATGQRMRSFKGRSMRVVGVAFSPDGRKVLTGNLDGTADLWDADSGQEVRTFAGHSGWVNSVAFSPDGRRILTGSTDQTAKMWDVQTGKVLRIYERQANSVENVAFTPDGRNVITIAFGGIAKLWGETGAALPAFKDSDRVYCFAFSADGRWLLTGGWDNTAQLRDGRSGEVIRSFRSGGRGGSIRSVLFSKDGKNLLIGSSDNTATLWDTESGKALRTFVGHTGGVNSVAFSPDGKRILTASGDGAAKVWDVESGRELCSLVSFKDGTWAVVDPEGRFDTNDLDGNRALHWILPDDPMHPLPLEIFMRDYYTPRLLTSIMSGDSLPPIRSIAEIKNRVQPEVTIVSAAPSKTNPGRADVVVHAASHISEKGQASGLEDLRLFRNGQMVGYLPGTLKSGDFNFRDIQLPTTAKLVTFTAYAFNSERIKSSTDERDYSYEAGPAAKPRAWLLQIGVNHYQAAGCELHGSANDAENLDKILNDRLNARGLDVKPALLVSTSETSGATKQKIRDALHTIAALATPDDVFFLSFSGHGYSNPQGQFYILPSDVEGTCEGVDERMLQSAISADELAEWLRPIDAGQMTFILDSCDSAGSVESNGFKPGPMGSRGLGQLAYDKRMRILAASQPNQAARESDALNQGLLSYALTEKGLIDGKADWQPQDGKIMVGEWLNYAASAVPKILQSGNVQTQRGLIPVGTPEHEVPSIQTPAVFDFSKEDTFVLQ